MTSKAKSFGGIEAGGTKFVCAVGGGPDNIRSKIKIETTTPLETLRRVIDFFREEMEHESIGSIGIGSFGPIDLNQNSPDYGCITSSPKSGWSDTNIVSILKNALNIPVFLDTDVNSAALGEKVWGAAKDLDTFIYITVGTGIGGGGMIYGQLMHGLVHPEMGHLRIPHNLHDDPFPGACPFHRDCLEGLASGAALEQRWNKAPEQIPPEHPAWNLEATYLAMGIVNYICTLSPKRIIIGGGVMKTPGLLSRVRQRTNELLNYYIKSPQITEEIESYIVPPALGDLSGVLGAIALAQIYEPK